MTSTSPLLRAGILGAALAAACSSSTAPTPPPPVSSTPKITCPAAPPVVTSPTGQPAAVVYGAATVVGGASPVTQICTPASGSPFPIGTTPVTCTATDAQQRTDSCTFNVVVQRAATLSLTRYLAFGDSITSGSDGVPFDQCTVDTTNSAPFTLQRIMPLNIVGSPYPATLQSLLRSRYPAQSGAITVDNFGVGGQPVYAPNTPIENQEPTRLANILTPAAGYQAVLLMEGSNDIFTANPARIAPALAGLQQMINTVKAANARPFLATIPPMVANKPRSCGAALVDQLNTGIRGLAQGGVTLVDVQMALATDAATYIGGDGLHPTQAGYDRIAQTFFDAIRGTLETGAATTATPTRLPPAAAPVSTIRRSAR